MNIKFIHLKAHTEYSIRDGLLRIKSWLEETARQKMPAIAITDYSNLFGVVKFYQHALTLGIKPIIGAEVCLLMEGEDFLITLLCQNQRGYKNLIKLLSQAYQEGQNSAGEPTLQWPWLAANAEGLIVLSGGRRGDVGRALLSGRDQLARERLQRWLEIFPQRFYLELQRSGRYQEEEYNQAAVTMAAAWQAPVVATLDIVFLKSEDFIAHEARVCINAGQVLEDPNRPRHYSEQQYMRSPDEMSELFADIPEALTNTVLIAQRCNVNLNLGEVHLPRFPLTDNTMSEADYFSIQAEQGLQQRIKNSVLDNLAPHAAYQKRLQEEIIVINRMGFASYFLIVADFIRWAKLQGIPVGPGRGSGAGSLVAYALGITELDPLQHELLFERFLNPERVSLPDFDIDFCVEGRDRVIEYVAERYGREAVAQIITFGTMAAKAALRDVGRVLGLPYGFVDKVAKLIPFELGITLEKALAEEKQLAERYRNEEEVAYLIDLARKLEGLTRNASKHAGGVVIAPTQLIDFVPLYREPGGNHLLVTQLDKDDVEAVGLVKFDFLGLRTLTIIHWALQTINQKMQQLGEKLVEITRIPLNDSKTFTMLCQCSTTAIFQLESRGMKELIRRLQPEIFEEITALVALFRPGPLQSGMVDDFIARKHGRAQVEYPHPDLEPILRTTHGVILYQEQVMQIAQTLAGYSLGEADILRRAMGKKKPEEMAKQRKIFVAGATKRGIAPAISEPIFDLMEKFAGYGFNKSHSAAYALIAYQTAWLKAHYPAEFMAAVLSADLDNTDKIANFLAECREMSLTILPPNLNLGKYSFTVNEKGQIVYGLGAIKGVGEAAISHLIEERQQRGIYKDLFDFCQRLDHRKINRRALEALIRSGSMDCFNQHRACLMVNIEAALKLAEQHQHNSLFGQADLFGSISSEVIKYNECLPWTDLFRLKEEKEVLGLYLSGHPLQDFTQELHALGCSPINKLEAIKKNAVCAGILRNQRIIHTRKGNPMAVVTLEDSTGKIDVTLFNKLYIQIKPPLQIDQVYLVRGSLEDDTYTGGLRIVADVFDTLASIRERFARRLRLKITNSQQASKLLQYLPSLLQPYRGGRCDIVIGYQSLETNAQMLLGESWSVNPSEELLERLKEICPTEDLVLEY